MPGKEIHNAAISRRAFLKASATLSAGLVVAFCLPVAARRAPAGRSSA